MRQSENNSFKLIRFFLSYTFLISYIVSIVSIVTFGYFVKNHREIEKYKHLTFWYENLDREIQYTKLFSDFVEEAQKKLTEDYNSYFRISERRRLPGDIEEKIIVDQSAPQEDSVPWKIGKTGESVNVYYGYSGVTDFNSKQYSNSNEIDKKQETKRNEEKKKSRNDKVFQNFTYIMLSQINKHFDNQTTVNENAIENLSTFSEVLINYLTGNKKYYNKIPNLRINNVYLVNISTGFLIAYPLTDEGYKQQIDFKSRPWFRATQNDYDSSFRKKDDQGNDSGITGVYIDINDENKPNAIRTLWYKFKAKDANNNQEYILCFDFFLDQSSQILKANNLDSLLYLLEQPIKSGIWITLLPLSFIVALCLSLIYKFKVKDIIVRISKHHANELFTIKLQRERKHYASKDEGEITFAIQGETKDINKSEHSREARWSFNIQNNIQVGVNNNQSNTRQQEAISRYEFLNKYNLKMSHNKPQYRCIETWRVVLESQSGHLQKIGFFVAKWNTNNSADIEEGLDIKSIYWEREYEEYLGILKAQLHEHLLVSDEPELVAVLDPNYSRQQNTPSFLTKIDSLKKTINSSLYLKQGKIVFSDIETLTELYQEGIVNAIFTLHFLRKLLEKQKLKYFFQTQVQERYLIEYQQGEFHHFYNSLDDATKSELLNQSPFKIMVYQDNIDNIVSPQDDFCIISINNTPKLVAYTFTDNKYSSTGWIGWISWREVDIKFYDELYRCQLDKNHRIEDINTYLRH